MTVAEIKTKLPEADIYAFNPNATHIIVVGHDQVPRSAVQEMTNVLSADGVKFCILLVSDPTAAVRVLEIVDSTPSTGRHLVEPQPIHDELWREHSEY